MYQKIVAKFNNISFAIVAGLCALLPLIFLPATAGGGSVVKGFVLFLGVFLAVSLWFIGQFIEGSLKIPKSPAFLALASWVGLSLVSALTSVNISVSLWGRGFVFDSFAMTLVLSLFVFMIATFARDQRRLVKLFLATFSGSALTIFLQVILYVSQRAPFVSKYLAHVANQGTLVGSWVDFAYFTTIVFLLALLMYEVLMPKGFFRILSLVTMVVSLVTLAFLNFKTAWIVTLASSLIVFVYKSSVERSLSARLPDLSDPEKPEHAKQQFPLMSLISLLVGLFFFLSNASIGAALAQRAGVSFNDIRPSFSATTSVLRSSLYHDPLFGAGAGRYADAWNSYHPLTINETIFWNTPFETGYNVVESIATTNGILPTIALVILLAFSLVHGFRLFNWNFSDRFTRFIAVTSLIMTLAFGMLLLFASPGVVLIVFGFVYIGLLFGVSSLAGKTKVVSIEYLKDPRMSFFAILLLVLASIAGFSAVYFTGNKFASIVFYNKAVASQDFASADRNLAKAIQLSNSDVYWRARTALYTNQFNTVAKEENPDKTQLQGLFSQAEKSAQAVVALDKNSVSAWLSLSQVYQLVAGGSNEDAIASATTAAQEAQKRNPNNPVLRLNNAAIAVLKKDTAGALSEIDQALSLKPNYLDAFILRGQIEQAGGDSQALKNEILKYIAVMPTDDQGYAILGNVYVQSKNYAQALTAFNQAKALAPSNANYYLSYIGALELSGDRSGTVEELQKFKKLFPTISGVDEQIKRLQNAPAPTPTSLPSTTTKKK